MKIRSFRHWSLREKVIVPVMTAGVLLTVCMYHVVGAAQRELLLAQADQSAAYVSTQIEADRQFYTEHVIKRLAGEGVALRPAALAEFAGTAGTIPLPAAFVHGTSKIVNGKGLHTANLLSLWNINPEKGPRSAEERRALEQVAANPRGAVSWVVDEDNANARFFRVTADVATSSTCVGCHNAHPKSSKKDFVLNDVMGALVVSLPLAKDIELARHNTWTWTATIGTVFAGLIALILFIQLRYVTRPIVELEKMADKISLGDVDTPVRANSDDEVGRLTNAFDRLRKSVQISMERLRKK